MKKIKYLAAVLLVLCLTISLCACGGNDDSNSTDPADTQASTAAQDSVGQTEGADEATEPPAEDGKVTYTVTVVDGDGNGVAGAMVQICMNTCYPGVTDASGKVQFSVPEEDYKVSFLSLPEGYTYSSEEQEFHFADGSTDLTIVLAAEG